MAWQPYGDLGAFVGLAMDVDATVVAGHDAMHDRQAEPRPLVDCLRGEEWLEHPRARRLVHAAAGVGDGQAQQISHRHETDLNPTRLGPDRLRGVGDEIEEDLMKLAGIA